MALLQKTSIGTFIFKSVDIYKMGCSQKHVQVIKNKKHKNYILHTKIKPINTCTLGLVVQICILR